MAEEQIENQEVQDTEEVETDFDWEDYWSKDETEEQVEEVPEQPKDSKDVFLETAEIVRSNPVIQGFVNLKGQGMSDPEIIKYIYDKYAEGGMYANPNEPDPNDLGSQLEKMLSPVMAKLTDMEARYQKLEQQKQLESVQQANAGSAFKLLNKYGLEATDDNATKFNKAMSVLYPDHDPKKPFNEEQIKAMMFRAFSKDIAANKRANKDATRQNGAPNVMANLNSMNMNIPKKEQPKPKTQAEIEKAILAMSQLT